MTHFDDSQSWPVPSRRRLGCRSLRGIAFLCLGWGGLFACLAPTNGQEANATGTQTTPAPAAATPAGPATPNGEELGRWVERLGSSGFREREEAERQLAGAGIAAREALIAGLRHSDPEVRHRARGALSVILEREFQRQVAELRANPAGDSPITLPGWKLYVDLVGMERASRKLFADMIAEEPGLFESLEAGAIGPVRMRVMEVFYRTMNQDGQTPEPPNRVTIAALLIASAQPGADSAEWANYWNNLVNYLQSGDFSEGLKEGELKPALQALVEAWVKSPAQSQLEMQKLRIAMMLNLNELALAKSIAMLTKAKEQPAQNVACALECVAMVGGKNYAALLEPLITDERVLQTRIMARNERQDIWVGDVALALLVDLAEQDLNAYGFKQAKSWLDIVRKQVQNRGNYIFNFGNFFLESNAQRPIAREKWAAWRKDHPLPEPPARSPLVEHFLAQGKPRDPRRVAMARANPLARRDAPDESQRGLQLADRELVTALKRVPAMFAERRFTEAARLLGDILASETDYFYRPDNNPTLLRQVKGHAEQLLASSGRQGLAEYELQFGALARSELEQALAKNDLRRLADVERRFFFTEAGTDAAFLLATRERTRGAFASAALYFERLRRLSPRADQYEPSLSSQLALCWHRAGMPSRALEVLAEWRGRDPRARLDLAGESFALPESAESWSEWLGRVFGATGAVASQWPVFAGAASGNYSTATGAPLLSGNPWRKLSSDPWLDSLVEQIPEKLAKQRRTQLPTIRPLVAGDRVVVRTPLGIACFSRATNEALWEAKSHLNLNLLLSAADDKQRQTRAAGVQAGLRRRFWEDLGFGAMTTDGRRVYALEDLGYRLSGLSKWLRVRDDGSREIDETPYVGTSALVAYDLETGKRLWEQGGATPSADRSTPSLAGGRFLGPALPFGDQALAVVEFPSQTLVVALDAATGRPLDQWVLDVSSDDGPTVVTGINMTWPAESPPLRAANPAYADGVLVARTSRDRYIAFDLTQRSVRWSFKSTPPEPADRRQALLARRLAVGMARGKADDHVRADEWCDAGPVLAEGRALVAPADEDKLYCLNLADGSVAWSAPRLDGLYVAGVVAGNVAVVGRSGVRGLRLADGQPAWDTPRIDWPGGATPSGRGYIARQSLYLPLTTAEIVGIDLRRGALVSRTRHPGRLAVGNLTQVDQEILSCSAAGLHRLESLEARAARLPELAADSPIADRVARAEFLLHSGRGDEALQILRDIPAAERNEGARSLLAETLILLPPAAIGAARTLGSEIVSELPDSPLRSELRQRLALAHRAAGDFTAAFACYVPELDVGDGLKRMQSVTAALQARRGGVLLADLKALWEAAPEAQRAELDRLMAERLARVTHEFELDCLGFHPAAQATRLRLARQRMTEQRWLAAELLLRVVWREGNEAERREAAAGLAETLRLAGDEGEAARFYGLLQSEFATEICANGMTGAQLAGQLPAGSPIARLMIARDAFPVEPPQTQADNSATIPTDAQGSLISMPLRPVGDGSRLAPRQFVALDSRNRRLFGLDQFGARRWSVEIVKQQGPSVLGLQNQGFAECRAAGHLTVVWLGSHIVAVDPWTDGGKVAWTRNLLGNDPNRWWAQGLVQRRIQIIAGGAAPTPAESQSHFVVTSRYVAFQEGRLLVVVDPLTGEELWVRDDLPAGCELLGDERTLVALPMDHPEALVFDAADGREIRRVSVELSGRRIGTTSTSILQLQTEGTPPRVERYDLATGKAAWSLEVDSKSRATLVDDREVAIASPAGKFRVVRADDARPVLEATLEFPEELDHIVALRNDDEYLVLANRVEPKSEIPVVFNRRQPGHHRVDGTVTLLRADSGEKVWHSKIEDQSLIVSYPTAAPVLTFVHRRQEVKKLDGGGFSSGPPTLQVLCLDRRTGRELHKAEFANQFDLSFRIQAEPQQRKFEFQTMQRKVTFQYPAP